MTLFLPSLISSIFSARVDAEHTLESFDSSKCRAIRTFKPLWASADRIVYVEKSRKVSSARGIYRFIRNPNLSPCLCMSVLSIGGSRSKSINWP